MLDSSASGFLEDFKQLAKQLNARHCLESVSGELSGLLLSNMPAESVLIMYGSLSLQRMREIDVAKFIYYGHQIEGFAIHLFLRRLSLWKKLLLMRRLTALLKDFLFSTISKEFGLHQLQEALLFYDQNQSKGKVIMKANLIP